MKTAWFIAFQNKGENQNSVCKRSTFRHNLINTCSSYLCNVAHVVEFKTFSY